MNNKYWIPLLTILILVTLLLLPACAKPAPAPSPAPVPAPAPAPAQGATVELSMVMFLPDIPPGNAFPHMLKDMAEGMSQGALVINIIGGPEAIPAADAPAAVQRGTVDMADAFGTYCDTIAPGADCLGRAEYDPAGLRANGAYDVIQEMFAKAGLYFLGAASPSVAQGCLCINLSTEIKHIEDFKGLKIADAGAQYKPFIEALGAVCVSIPTPDNFTAMERGTVDGYVLGVPGIQDFGLTPVTDFMLDETFTSSGAWFIVNLEKWNSLPPNLQGVLNQAAIQTEIEGCKIWDIIVGKVKEEISAAGVKIIKLPPDESKEFYRIYRESMSAFDLNRHPEEVGMLQKLLLNPDFDRLK